MATGITKLHSQRCRSRTGGRCNCNAGWEASVWSNRDCKKIRKTFAREAEAKTWRGEALSALAKGALRAPAKITIRRAGEALLAGMESGEIRSRSGQRFKPKTIRGYRQALSDRIYPAIGPQRISAVTASDLQTLVDRWLRQGLAPSTIRNAIKPLQVIYRRAVLRHGLPINPTRDLELPAAEVHEIEIVSPQLAAQLIAALPDRDQPIWSTAFYAGLRYGELQGLRREAVSLPDGLIDVCESWDAKEGRITPKTSKSRRKVPIPALLHDVISDQCLEKGARDLVFGQNGRPFQAASLYRRADRAWKSAGLDERVRLHQARHTYASFMIAARVNAKAISTYMGHSSIKVTYDLYGHLMPGSEAEAAELLNRFLTAQVKAGEDAARQAGGHLIPQAASAA